MGVEVVVVVQLVVGAAGEAVAGAIVAVLADGVVVVEGRGEGREGIERRLDVVDAAAVVIVGAADENAKLLAWPKRLAARCRQTDPLRGHS